MLIKAMIIPFVLIICFGGGFVALTKPFNPKATIFIAGIAISAMVFGYAAGLMRLFGAIGLVVSLFGLYACRGKK
ncbi:MAG: hypothetical protein WCI55_07535 [Armatimonadota bacterium]